MFEIKMTFDTLDEALEFLQSRKGENVDAIKDTAPTPKKKKVVKKKATNKSRPVATQTQVEAAKPVLGDAAVSPSGMTLDDLMTRIRTISGQLGPRAAELSDLLTEFGVAKTSDLPPAQYDRFVEAAEAKVGGPGDV